MHIPIEEDLELRLLEMKFADELFALTDRNRAHLRCWLPWLDITKTVEDSKYFLNMVIQQNEDGKGPQYGIFYKGHLVGITGFHPLNLANKKGAIGYWLDQQSSGLGIMTKATRAMVDLGFNDLNLERITIACATENKGSRALAERLGFKHEANLRSEEWLYDHFVNHAVYGLLKEEYRSSLNSPIG